MSQRLSDDNDDFVKTARDTLKLTQAELSSKIGLERRSIIRYEQGEELPLTVRLAIMRLLDVHKLEEDVEKAKQAKLKKRRDKRSKARRKAMSDDDAIAN